MMDGDTMVIFERSSDGREAKTLQVGDVPAMSDIPRGLLRPDGPALPAVGELQVVRHYTNLSKKNFSIDGQLYPLGSCTMKYNPRAAHAAASIEGFRNRHPLAPESRSQGFLQCLYELQEYLKELTGMQVSCLTPMAGAQGEFAGIAMIQAYHRARGDEERREILIPSAAHGTNPASAVMCGYEVKEVPVTADGDVDVAALKTALGPQTAGLMMTNPSTCGVFERQIQDIADALHEAGALLYYDGANLNAILGKVKPGDMGFDVLHMNLHKTFGTPHGGGGPGAGPVAVGEALAPYTPGPIVERYEHGGEARYRWMAPEASIGRLSAFMGNAGILLRAYAYARLLGRDGLREVGEIATLNANYMAKKLVDAGYELAYPERRATHEFIVTVARQAREDDVKAVDIAKRLLDYGYHAPTTYFPLLIPECLLIEPTETECREEIDGFVEAMAAILREVKENPEALRSAPHDLPVSRLDDVRAARQLDLVWRQDT